MIPYYALCLLQSKRSHKFKIHAEQKPHNSFFPKWLRLELSQVYTNIKSAAANLRNVQDRLTEEGYKSVIFFELLMADF